MTQRKTLSEVQAKIEAINGRIRESFDADDDLFFTCSKCGYVINGSKIQLLHHAEICQG